VKGSKGHTFKSSLLNRLTGWAAGLHELLGRKGRGTGQVHWSSVLQYVWVAQARALHRLHWFHGEDCGLVVCDYGLVVLDRTLNHLEDEDTLHGRKPDDTALVEWLNDTLVCEISSQSPHD
jgi:hypothetical protein